METKIFTDFFKKAPALYWALFALFGTLFGKTHNGTFLIPLLPLLFYRPFPGLTLFFLFYLTHLPQESTPLTKGSGIFTIGEIQEQKGYLLIRGQVHLWNGVSQTTPASIKVKKSEEERIAFHKRLFLIGSLKNPTHIEPNTRSSLSIPWLRFYAKKFLQKVMVENHPNGAILSSLLFGSPVPKHISTSIKRFGLSHLFAISGFHFNLITTLLALMIRPWVSYRIFHWVILTLLTLYALLIGPNASLLRGFLAQAILFLGLALHKTAFSLNSLGLGLLFINLFFPDLVSQLGFIFSFIITFALLLLNPLVSKLFPPKPVWLTAPLSLLLTVELTSFPLNLTLFGTYPLLAPLYNLFVTPLISCTLFLAPLTLIPYLCNLIYIPLNIALWTFEVPPGVDLYLHYNLSPFILTIYLTALFTLGIILSRKREQAV